LNFNFICSPSVAKVKSFSTFDSLLNYHKSKKWGKMCTKANENFSNSNKNLKQQSRLTGFTLLAKLTLSRAFATVCSVARFTVQNIQITEGRLASQTKRKQKPKVLGAT